MSGLEDMINGFNEMNIVGRIVVGCCAVFIVLMILSLVGHAVLGIPTDSFTEDTSTRYKDFAQLDINGDGGLSFDEVKSYDHNSKYSISHNDLFGFFGNGEFHSPSAFNSFLICFARRSCTCSNNTEIKPGVIIKQGYISLTDHSGSADNTDSVFFHDDPSFET